MKSGIYKITNPKGKVYIGKANWIARRWNEHRNEKCSSSGPKLKNSLKKYGVDRHLFEIVEICSKGTILERERFYQEYYNSIEEGLNHIYTNTSENPGGNEIECYQCQTKFRKSPSHITIKNFCCNECREEYYKSTRNTKTCKCGKQFTFNTKENKKYCSRKCYHVDMKGNQRAAK